MDRIFLGWDRPVLSAAAECIRATVAPGELCDLSGTLIVVPGRRAARRMLELLLEQTGGRLQPPQIVTVSALPELLYEPQWPFAGELTQKLAWIKALRGLSAGEAALVVRELPAKQDFTAWLALAELLQQHHRELAAYNLSFRNAADIGGDLQGETERARWSALAHVQERYLDVLDGLQLWDQQTARLEAIRRGECQTNRTVYLIGTSDLDTIFCRMLDQVSAQVRVLVGAPEELAHRFDEYGRVVPQEWQDAPIPLPAESVHVVDGPEDQADQVARVLADLGTGCRADEITIGMPDEGLVPGVRRLLQECGVATRWFVGQVLSDSAPCRLLAALAELLEDGSISAFTSFVRHPDVSTWISQKNVRDGWLTKLDEFIQATVPARFPPDRIPEDHDGWIVRRVVDSVAELCRPFSGPPRPLTEWGAPILEFLVEVFSRVDLDSSLPGHVAVLTAAERIQAALARHDALPAELVPSVPAATALHLLLRDVGNEPLPSPADPEAVEMLGWLELPLDDAPALVATNFNEGFVPQSVNADPFLPDQLRTRLGIVDNRRRYARDAYALSLLLHSRKCVRLIAGRRDRRGDPLAPSRLLLASDADTVARRILEFYEAQPARSLAPLAGRLDARQELHTFSIPRPRDDVEPPQTIRVTALREFLDSPYRYYLHHVERLGELDDQAEELGAQAFGILAHDVLADFGRSELKDSRDASAIRDFLSRTLDEEATRRFGEARSVAVEVQVEQLRSRLASFAEWQAAHAAEGWSIEHVEKDCRCEEFDAGAGKTVCLTARIDRIDKHPGSGQWAIYDYKTGEGTKSPHKTHRAGEEWIDLQLPLYRLLAREIGVTGEPLLGYLQIAPDSSTVEDIAGWTKTDLENAEKRAREAVREILEGRYWQTLKKPPRWTGDLGAICQDGVFNPEAVV
jgi:RecB family exonuclease